jgi:hypothetical protein
MSYKTAVLYRHRAATSTFAEQVAPSQESGGPSSCINSLRDRGRLSFAGPPRLKRGYQLDCAILDIPFSLFPFRARGQWSYLLSRMRVDRGSWRGGAESPDGAPAGLKSYARMSCSEKEDLRVRHGDAGGWESVDEELVDGLSAKGSLLVCGSLGFSSQPVIRLPRGYNSLELATKPSAVVGYPSSAINTLASPRQACMTISLHKHDASTIRIPPVR